MTRIVQMKSTGYANAAFSIQTLNRARMLIFQGGTQTEPNGRSVTVWVSLSGFARAVVAVSACLLIAKSAARSS